MIYQDDCSMFICNWSCIFWIVTHSILDYRRNWLLSACAYNTRQQENMRLTGSMRLIKSAKRSRRGVRKERGEGRKAYNGGQEAIRERNS